MYTMGNGPHNPTIHSRHNTQLVNDSRVLPPSAAPMPPLATLLLPSSAAPVPIMPPLATLRGQKINTSVSWVLSYVEQMDAGAMIAGPSILHERVRVSKNGGPQLCIL